MGAHVPSMVGNTVQSWDSPEEVTLRWKNRGGPDGTQKATKYGSYEITLPKGKVEQLRWRTGERFQLEANLDRMVLTRSASKLSNDEPGGHGSHFKLDRIICGDVLEEMRRIPDGTVAMAITSPPYNVGAGYAGYDDSREYQAYRGWLSEVWKETRRVLCRGGRFALNVAPTSISNYRPVHMDLSQDVIEAGLTPRTEILWYKQNMTAKRTAWGSFRSPRHPHIIPSWEYVLLFHKDSWKIEGDPQMATIRSEDFVAWSNGYWSIAPETAHHANHPAAFPEELIRRLILYFTYKGNTVLDMFGGTGTVAYVANQLQRRYIHIDVSPEYCAAAEQRLQGRLPRGKRTKPSERSLVRRAKPRARGHDQSPSIEWFGSVDAASGPAPNVRIAHGPPSKGPTSRGE